MKQNAPAKPSNIPEAERAMQYALRVLGYRQRSEREIKALQSKKTKRVPKKQTEADPF